jgi:hypothetical protein
LREEFTDANQLDNFCTVFRRRRKWDTAYGEARDQDRISMRSGIHNSEALTSAQQGEVLYKERAGDSNYCHMKFPAIDERTLGARPPQLKPPTSGDVIDFYGPCDHDPNGALEVAHQKLERSLSLSREYDS